MSKRAYKMGMMRSAFLIARYHTVSYLLKPETVGHHTCNVIALVFYLSDDNPSINLVRAALQHDVPEAATGDVPAQVKWANPDLRNALDRIEGQIVEELELQKYGELTPQEQIYLKFADIFDLCTKAVEEMSAGNAPFDQILARGLAVVFYMLDNELKGHPRAQELVNMLINQPYVDIERVQVETAKSPSKTAH